MFVTGALSTLLPYALFFGMLLLFAVQSHTKQAPDTNQNLSAKVQFQITENCEKDQTDSFQYYDSLKQNSVKLVSERKPRLKPPERSLVSITPTHKQLPILYVCACMPMRAPPFVA